MIQILPVVACLLLADPRADVIALIEKLGDQSQEVRDVAAAKLRESYKEAPRSRWEALYFDIRYDDKEKTVIEKCHKAGIEAEAANGMAMGTTRKGDVRLDDCWVLRCTFRSSDDGLADIELVKNTNLVWVAPPKDFSGRWTVYLANGQIGRQTEYKNGKRDGDSVDYRSDGTKSVSVHYSVGGPDTWTSYNKKGVAVRTEKYPNTTP